MHDSDLVEDFGVEIADDGPAVVVAGLGDIAEEDALVVEHLCDAVPAAGEEDGGFVGFGHEEMADDVASFLGEGDVGGEGDVVIGAVVWAGHALEAVAGEGEMVEELREGFVDGDVAGDCGEGESVVGARRDGH